jgi:hypothetical protein
MAFKILLLSFLLLVQVLAGKDDPFLGLNYESPQSAEKAKGKTPLRYSSVLTFPTIDNVWKDVLGEDPKKLSEVARNAMWQMSGQWIAEGISGRHQPTVMTALAVGNEIYLSSSLAG